MPPSIFEMYNVKTLQNGFFYSTCNVHTICQIISFSITYCLFFLILTRLVSQGKNVKPFYHTQKMYSTMLL